MKKVFILPVSDITIVYIPLPSQAAVLAYLIGFMPLKKWRDKFLKDTQNSLCLKISQTALKNTEKKTEQRQMWLWAI